LIKYVQDMSDHVVRPGPSFDPFFHGTLVPEWPPDQRAAACTPICVLWLYDEFSRTERNDAQQLSRWQRDMPLLPVWSFGTDQRCHGVAAVIMADAHGSGSSRVAHLDPRVYAAIVSEGQHDAFGLPADRQPTTTAIQLYKQQ